MVLFTFGEYSFKGHRVSINRRVKGCCGTRVLGKKEWAAAQIKCCDLGIVGPV